MAATGPHPQAASATRTAGGGVEQERLVTLQAGGAGLVGLRAQERALLLNLMCGTQMGWRRLSPSPERRPRAAHIQSPRAFSPAAPSTPAPPTLGLLGGLAAAALPGQGSPGALYPPQAPESHLLPPSALRHLREAISGGPSGAVLLDYQDVRNPPSPGPSLSPAPVPHLSPQRTPRAPPPPLCCRPSAAPSTAPTPSDSRLSTALWTSAAATLRPYCASGPHWAPRTASAPHPSLSPTPQPR